MRLFARLLGWILDHLFGLLAVSIPMFMVGVGYSAAFGCVPTYSSGERTGVVTKISRKGVFIKSWEGQMALGGFQNGAGAFGETWDFSTMDDALAEKLRKTSEAGERITVLYHEWLISPIRIQTSHEAEAIKEH